LSASKTENTSSKPELLRVYAVREHVVLQPVAKPHESSD
jgi:hypothetical protein